MNYSPLYFLIGMLITATAILVWKLSSWQPSKRRKSETPLKPHPEILVVCSSSTRPAYPQNLDCIYETDTGRIMEWTEPEGVGGFWRYRTLQPKG